MGEESPDILVAAAYDQSDLGPGFSGSGPISSSVADMDSMATNAMPNIFSQTLITPPDSDYYHNGSDTSQEPGSSDMDMAEYLNADDSYLHEETTNRSAQPFEPPIHPASRRSIQPFNDTVSLDDVRDDKGFSGSGYFDEALGDANAGMHYYVADVGGK